MSGSVSSVVSSCHQVLGVADDGGLLSLWLVVSVALFFFFSSLSLSLTQLLAFLSCYFSACSETRSLRVLFRVYEQLDLCDVM